MPPSTHLIYELIAQHGPINVTKLAELTGFVREKVNRKLVECRQLGLVKKVPWRGKIRYRGGLFKVHHKRGRPKSQRVQSEQSKEELMLGELEHREWMRIVKFNKEQRLIQGIRL